MSSKTKIVVLHMKELIYTAVFVILGILLIVLLIYMFVPGDQEEDAASAATYTAGIYTSSITLNNHTIDMEVTVDADHVNSIRLVNVSEAVTTLYPLMEPALEELSTQIYEKQSLENITYPEENKYTSVVLLEAIENALSKARTATD